ncbi:MAG: serine hydrolase domain-containing protein [Steroidobacteraceae bacterium]
MKPVLASVVLLAFGAAGQAAPATVTAGRFSPPFDTTVNDQARAYLSATCHVGLSIVARNGAQVRFFGYGSIVRGYAVKPTPDNVYELASVTKTFTGALAAKALVEHKMTLDGDFRAYLPGEYPNLILNGKPISLRTLATHTSGLQRDLPDSEALMAQHDYDRIGYGLAALDRGFTASRTLAALHAATLRTTPRTTFVYSNLGIRVIGYGLEHQYRSSFAALLDSVIFRPLGMHETGFDPTAAMMARLVTPYNRYGHAQPYHDASGRDLIARSAELIRHVGGYLRAVRVTGGHA